ncbi:MAG: phospholipase [Pirellulales bacterium]|nr:phospholipase [Pirellulales bacterium]
MSVTAAALRELHRIHRQLRDLRGRLEAGPKQVKHREAVVQRIAGELEQAKADHKAARIHADQKQLQLRSAEQKIRDLKLKLNAASSNREYQALRDQIAADEMASSVLEDEILELLEKIEAMARGIKEIEEKLAKSQEELANCRMQVADQEALLRADIDRLEAELAQAETQIPVDFRELYERVVRSKGDEGMAQVEGETCSGCYQRVTPNKMNQLLLGQVIVCGGCGRILYLPEDRSPRA